MPASNAVKERIRELVSELSEVNFHTDTSRKTGWVTAAHNAVALVCTSSGNSYRVHSQRIFDRAPNSNLIDELVSDMSAMLRRLLEEIDRGLLTTVENYAIALTFDDFLAHGAEYLKHGRKDEAAVIAGIVFEDTIRRICRVLGVPENGTALDTLITELAKRDPPILTALKAKRARAAAGLRTSAAHARWEEIGLGDVAPVIDLTKELIGTHLA